jgi:hypothetical protein
LPDLASHALSINRLDQQTIFQISENGYQSTILGLESNFKEEAKENKTIHRQ